MAGRRNTGKPRRKRYRFTRADCQKGYQAALAKCSQDWGLYAWFYSKLRAHYRAKRRSSVTGTPKGESLDAR